MGLNFSTLYCLACCLSACRLDSCPCSTFMVLALLLLSHVARAPPAYRHLFLSECSFVPRFVVLVTHGWYMPAALTCRFSACCLVFHLGRSRTIIITYSSMSPKRLIPCVFLWMLIRGRFLFLQCLSCLAFSSYVALALRSRNISITCSRISLERLMSCVFLCVLSSPCHVGRVSWVWLAPGLLWIFRPSLSLSFFEHWSSACTTRCGVILLHNQCWCRIQLPSRHAQCIRRDRFFGYPSRSKPSNLFAFMAPGWCLVFHSESSYHRSGIFVVECREFDSLLACSRSSAVAWTLMFCVHWPVLLRLSRIILHNLHVNLHGEPDFPMSFDIVPRDWISCLLLSHVAWVVLRDLTYVDSASQYPQHHMHHDDYQDVYRHDWGSCVIGGMKIFAPFRRHLKCDVYIQQHILLSFFESVWECLRQSPIWGGRLTYKDMDAHRHVVCDQV